MFNVFTDQIEMFDCTIEIDVNGNKQIQRIRAPRIIIEQQFMQLFQEAANDGRPIKIALKRDVDCFNKYTSEHITRENSIEFENKAYVEDKQYS